VGSLLKAVLQEWQEKSEKAISLCKNRDVAVQAGGNVGIFPCYLAATFREVVTFEPFKRNIACFKRNVSDRRVENITLHEAALGMNNDTVGVTYAPQDNCGAVSLGGKGDIPTMTLDELQLPSCDLLWLDVEGFEVKALMGAAETIAKYKPVIILENKGLVEGYGGTLAGGSVAVRRVVEDMGYTYHKRMMRDDFFLPNS